MSFACLRKLVISKLCLLVLFVLTNGHVACFNNCCGIYLSIQTFSVLAIPCRQYNHQVKRQPKCSVQGIRKPHVTTSHCMLSHANVYYILARFLCARQHNVSCCNLLIVGMSCVVSTHCTIAHSFVFC